MYARGRELVLLRLLRRAGSLRRLLVLLLLLLLRLLLLLLRRLSNKMCGWSSCCSANFGLCFRVFMTFWVVFVAFLAFFLHFGWCLDVYGTDARIADPRYAEISSHSSAAVRCSRIRRDLLRVLRRIGSRGGRGGRGSLGSRSRGRGRSVPGLRLARSKRSALRNALSTSTSSGCRLL